MLESAPPDAPRVTTSDPHAARTLSGRPVVEGVATRPTTRVGRGTVVFAVTLAVALVVGVSLVLLGRGPEGTDVRAMAPGDCYVETDVVEEDGRSVPYGTDTPCLSISPRIVAVVPLPIGRYPGEAGFDQVVADRCGGEADMIVAPTSNTWPAGDRTVVCIALPEV
ncbi:MAG: hypothetical protein ABW279_15930 [Acidimicrobiales bacterium]